MGINLYLRNMETKLNPQERIAYLSQVLEEHNHNYYVLNAPTISDYDFDILMRELQDLEAAYPQYAQFSHSTRR